MSAGTYVLAASVFYRVEGDPGVRKRYKRGDKVALSATEAERLAKGTARFPAAFVKASSDEGEAAVEVGGPELVSAPVVPDPTPAQEAGALLAEANTIGIAPAGADPSDDRPAKSATVDVWRAYAIRKGVPEDEANELNKAELQDRTR